MIANAGKSMWDKYSKTLLFGPIKIDKIDEFIFTVLEK